MGDKRSPPNKIGEVILVSKEMRFKLLNMKKEALTKKLLVIQEELRELNLEFDKEMELGV
jgi:vacuolar-type H+-ATPase subunit D/Vma8